MTTPIALQLYTLRDPLAQDYEGTVRKVADMGYVGVETANLPRIEIYGSEGSISMPDPNTFDGPVHVKTAEDEEWRDVPLVNGHTENSRGLGVCDMAAAIRENRPHRASSEMAFHVLDLMQSFEEASTSGQHIEIQSRCERPAAL